MTVLEVVKRRIRVHGFHGLYNERFACGCLLVEDLAPCGEMAQDCRLGFKVTCKGCDQSDKPHWHVQEKKP